MCDLKVMLIKLDQYSQGQTKGTSICGLLDVSTFCVLVAKHLQCIIPIPPGEIEHVGTHSHSLEDDVFHYCKSQ